MTGFVNIAPWPESEGENIPSFVGNELSFLKLGSVLIGLIGDVSNLLESQYSQTVVSQATPLTGHRVLIKY